MSEKQQVFSRYVLRKAKRYIDEGRVLREELDASGFRIRGEERVYLVQTDLDPETHNLTQITCTCQHGAKKGLGFATCCHAAATLMILREKL